MPLSTDAVPAPSRQNHLESELLQKILLDTIPCPDNAGDDAPALNPGFSDISRQLDDIWQTTFVSQWSCLSRQAEELWAS